MSDTNKFEQYAAVGRVEHLCDQLKMNIAAGRKGAKTRCVDYWSQIVAIAQKQLCQAGAACEPPCGEVQLKISELKSEKNAVSTTSAE